MYKDINIVLATKHKKEQAIEKPFQDAFQAKLFVPDDYDTDQFGTFSGEIPRIESAYSAVINKAKLACQDYQFFYGVANEGSFGPHPSIYFLPADVELMSFVDVKNDIVVVESEITTETNYGYRDITISDSYDDFLVKMKFGSHGIILRALDNNYIIAKGVNTIDHLRSLLNANFRIYQKIRLETDMRAMMNPTRMGVISRLATKLIDRLKKYCKKCNAPGFGELSVTGRLLCGDCGAETELYKYRILECIKCDYKEHLPRADGLTKSDPKNCPYCNP